MDERASETYNKNLLGKCFNEKLTIDSAYPKADIVIGGPPCQPFSVGGKQLGLKRFTGWFSHLFGSRTAT
jgi:DNA (cytosine-5)-methyltransferase 1